MNQPNAARIQSLMPVQNMRHGTGFTAQGVRGTDTQMDPFLMADHFHMSQPTFGPHPHAGFSAVTYMLDDAQTGFQNQDSLGDRSVIAPGDAHWTVAGAGAVHNEVPITNGLTAHGLQIFVNLAARDKHIKPHSIHIKAKDMAVVEQRGAELHARVKVAFGTYQDESQQATTATSVALPTAVTLLDVLIEPSKNFAYPIQPGTNAFFFVISGSVTADQQELTQGQAAALGSAGGMLQITAQNAPAQIALFMGAPLNEPVVRHGPFAMSNRADIEQAIADYQSGKMGTLS